MADAAAALRTLRAALESESLEAGLLHPFLRAAAVRLECAGIGPDIGGPGIVAALRRIREQTSDVLGARRLGLACGRCIVEDEATQLRLDALCDTDLQALHAAARRATHLPPYALPAPQNEPSSIARAAAADAARVLAVLTGLAAEGTSAPPPGSDRMAVAAMVSERIRPVTEPAVIA